MELEKLTPTLEGNRIWLRPVNLTDAQAMFEYTNNPTTIHWTTTPYQEKISETVQGIEDYFLQNTAGKYGIILKSENKLVGTIDIRWQESFYDLGYILNEKYQGFGYATEALELLLGEVFEKTEIPEVFLIIDIENLKSNHLAKKFGFQIKKRFWEFNNKLNQEREFFLYCLKKQIGSNLSLS